MEKETHTLVNNEIVGSVTVLGYWKSALPTQQQLHPKVTLERIQTFRHSRIGGWFMGLSNLFRYPILLLSFPEYCLKALFRLLWRRPRFIACHNLILLPVAVVGKLISGGRLIYVPHELETHRTGLKGPLVLLSKLIERCCIPFVNSTIVVCDPIARWYEHAYNIPEVYVVPNVPYHPCRGTAFKKTTLLRQHFGIRESDIICLYQGLISNGRGIEQLLEVFQSLPSDRHLVIMGFGELSDLVKEQSLSFPNIHFKDAVPVNDILAWTSSADVGLFFNSQRMTLSYQYSLPNKFFEYAIGGLYIVISDNFVEQARYLEDHSLGIAIKPELQALKTALLGLTRQEIADKIKDSVLFRKSIGWQSFENVYRLAYGIHVP